MVISHGNRNREDGGQTAETKRGAKCWSQNYRFVILIAILIFKYVKKNSDMKVLNPQETDREEITQCKS